MASTIITGDLSVFTMGGEALLAYLKDASIAFNVDSADGSPVTRAYESAQATKKSALIRASGYSDAVASVTRDTNLSVTLFSVGANAMIGYLESGSLSVDWSHKDTDGPADLWKYPVCAGKKKITLEGTLFCPAVAGSGSQAFPVLGGHVALETTAAEVGRLAVVAAVSFAGVDVSFPALITKIDHQMGYGDIQKFAVTMEGKETFDAATAFPVGPTGTSTMLEKFLNTTAAMTVAITNHATEGVAYAGNALPLSYSIGFSQAGILTREYTWASQGAITPTIN